MENHQSVNTNCHKNSASVNTEYNNRDLTKTNGNAHRDTNDTVSTNYSDWDLSKSDGQSFHDSENADQTIINGKSNFSPNATCENSEWDLTESDYQNYPHIRGHGTSQRNFRHKNSTNNANKEIDKLKSEKSAIPKSTYITPDFEENDNLAIEDGVNFTEYDKIKVTVSGMEIPKHIKSFKNCGLHDILLSNLEKCNYMAPTPIQKYALPIIMNGRDMIATSQTGSGNTAAFIIPILNSLSSDPTDLIVDCNHCEPQAIIISTTRELAIQICEVATRLSKNTIIKCEPLYGGTSINYQKKKILMGVHIIVATLGRLIDFVNRGLITFSSLRFFVLDETDQMLEMRYQLEIEFILSHSTMVSSDDKTTIMFSETLPEEIQQVAKSYLKSNYISVTVGEVGEVCKNVTQTFIEVTKFNKKKVLINWLSNIDDCQGTIVFVNIIRQADFIASFLCQLNYPSTSIHGDRAQPEREIALNDFKSKKMKILVATAVVARGLDIEGVTTVLNFDLPKTIEEYVHRIGRIGRLGNASKAISFYDPENDYVIAPYLVNILTKAKQEIPEFLSEFCSSGVEPTDQFNDIRKDVSEVSDLNELEEW